MKLMLVVVCVGVWLVVSSLCVVCSCRCMRYVCGDVLNVCWNICVSWNWLMLVMFVSLLRLRLLFMCVCSRLCMCVIVGGMMVFFSVSGLFSWLLSCISKWLSVWLCVSWFLLLWIVKNVFWIVLMRL